MRPAALSIGKIISGTVFVALILTFTAVPAQASSFTYNSVTHTYTYNGDAFNVCGFGCAQNAPANVFSDFLIVTLTFSSELAPNLSNNASQIPTGWTMHDFLNSFSFSGVGQPNGIPADGGDPPTPGLVLSTDASRNIVGWLVSASAGFVNQQGDFVGTEAAILNPPIFCGQQCGFGGISDALVIAEHTDREWDAFRIVPAVPEPGTLTLVGAGLLAVGRRRRGRQS